MPRVHHLADANHMDCYDSFALRPDTRAALANGLRLFGHENISFLMDRSNLQVAGQLVRDQTSMIANLYARTNITHAAIDASPRDMARAAVAFNQWANLTSVTLFVGQKPVRQSALANLLARKAGDRDADAIPPGEADAYFDDLASRVYEAYREAGGTGLAWQTLPDRASLGQAGQLGKAPWLSAAHAAHRNLKSPQITIVPPRQNVSVAVQCNAHALGNLLELIPKGIAPMPLVWIHLEGFSRRDVC